MYRVRGGCGYFKFHEAVDVLERFSAVDKLLAENLKLQTQINNQSKIINSLEIKLRNMKIKFMMIILCFAMFNIIYYSI